MKKNSVLPLNSGNSIPILGLGTWQLTKDTASTIKYAIELGYPLIDTSSDYGTQPGIAEGLKKSGVKREDIYIVTKVEETDDSYDRTKSNLKELDLDYIDLMLIHRPPPNGVGEELWEGLTQARDEGLIRDIGVSNYSMEQIKKLSVISDEIPAVNQIEWSPFGYSEEMKIFCRENNIILQAYSPLTRATRLDNPTLLELGQKYDKSPAQILIRWNLEMGTCPLPKANQKKHLEENIDVFDFELTEEDLKTLNRMNENYSSLGSLPYL